MYTRCHAIRQHNFWLTVIQYQSCQLILLLYVNFWQFFCKLLRHHRPCMHCMPCILRCVTLNLCRWRIVIHGGIDGYSRIPVFLKASNNNKASTVLACFLEAVSEFGLPSRVRSDKGGENVEVSTFMLNHVQRGPGRGSMITGTILLC